MTDLSGRETMVRITGKFLYLFFRVQFRHLFIESFVINFGGLQVYGIE